MTLSALALDTRPAPSHHIVMQLEHHLVGGYCESLRKYIVPRLNNKSDVDDIIQDTFIRYHSYNSDIMIESPIGYLLRIASNLIHDRGRKKSLLSNSIEISSVSEELLQAEPRQEDGRRLSDLQAAYEAALAELPPRRREVFRLRRQESMLTPQVAETLSITPRMVQKHMMAAMEHLQERLRPFLDDDINPPSDSGSQIAVRRANSAWQRPSWRRLDA